MPLSSRPPRGRRLLATGTGVALAAASLAVIHASPAQAADPVEIQILATNDFHGRINDNNLEGGAAVLSGAVKQLRAANANTVFAAAGDLIGASTFESFIQKDKPTIDALNEAGLEVSAVGNHEFDQGYDDLVNRVMKPQSAQNPLGGAEWEYIGANVKVKTGSTAPGLDPSWVKTFNPGADEIKVGFVGAVTEELPSLVSPTGIEDIEVTDIVDAANAEADALKAQENLDLVVLLVHEGAPSTDCDTMDDTGVFADIVKGVNANVDAIVSGHTHLAYDCKFSVPAWSARPVKERPVVSAGQYGMNLNQLEFTVDPDDGAITGLTTAILPLVDEVPNPDPEGDPTYEPNYTPDPAVTTIVDAANAKAEVEGKKPVGRIDGAFDRARFAGGAAENRGGESTLGNLVAEIQRWATRTAALGGAQIAFMNPGGLRADLRGVNAAGEDAGPYPRQVNLRGAANVQPFANSLVNMDLTGAQIEEVLEEQWQPTAASRPFLKLGVSEGFTYTYAPPAADAAPGTKGEVLGMWLKGKPLVPTETYSVTVNSFLAGGGDNFTTLRDGTNRAEAGLTDLEAQVAYFKANVSATNPLKVDYSQRAVGVRGLPEAFTPGQAVTFELSSLSMTGPTDVTDNEVLVFLGNEAVGRFPVTTVAPPVGNENSTDEIGTATVTFTVPAGSTAGPEDLVVFGAKTWTCVGPKVCPRPVQKATPNLTVKTNPARAVAGKTRVKVISVVRAAGAAAKGRITVKAAGKTYNLRLNKNGRAVVKLPKFAKPGKKVVRVKYLGNATTTAGSIRATFRVVKPKK